ncbi:hypothetical protein DXV76_19300 [Rhodobacteraceae bacterium CCMM004]|nr:hypothetical protein DXV76_19300 [Rhodobacteraceae bacterium CCMM004]
MWEIFNRSKVKSGAAPGDDVGLAVPGHLGAVFDGVTGPQVDPATGLTGGRAAALAAAAAALALPPEMRTEASAAEIAARLSAAVGEARAARGFADPIATTAAIVFDLGAQMRLMVIGDSGIRVNAVEVHVQEIAVDAVTVALRLPLWAALAERLGAGDATEARVRAILRSGVDRAVAEGEIAAETADRIERAACAVCAPLPAAEVRAVARGGTRSQGRLANAGEGPLAYPVLDGRPPKGALIDVRLDRAGLTSLEVFSDGYGVLPDRPDIAAWEAAYRAADRRDPYRIGAHPGVKGATAEEWFDDRTVAIWRPPGDAAIAP